MSLAGQQALYSGVQCIMCNGHMGSPPRQTDRQTDRQQTTEKVTYLQLRWRAVVIVKTIVVPCILYTLDHGMAMISQLIFSGEMKAGGTISLIKGKYNIVVDTGGSRDKSLIISGKAF